MIHAYLITAYNKFEHLKELIYRLDSPNSYIYLYIDAKVDIPEYIREIKTVHTITILHQRRVEWGDQSQIITELDLFSEAFQNPDIEWFHLISGTDFPLKRIEQINAFYEQAENVDCFMETEPIPAHLSNRVELYHFHVRRNNSINPLLRYILRKTLALQYRLGVCRKHPENLPFLYGSNWGDFRRKAVEALLGKRREILKSTKYTSIANEVYKQSFLQDKGLRIVNDNKRYIDWTQRAPSPKSLLPEDYQTIIESDKLFARKFDSPESEKLRQHIIEHIERETV